LPEQNDNYVNKVKASLLQMLIYKCKSKTDLTAIGGLIFFQRILRSNDPTIAYIAGQYIISQLEEEDPQQYIAILSKLLIKAQEEDDENIVSNHYLQMKTLLEMSNQEEQYPQMPSQQQQQQQQQQSSLQ